MSQRREIIVVGGGAVGAALALALLRAGFDVGLIERGHQPKPHDPQNYDPRVLALGPAATGFMTSLGVWPSIAAQRASPFESMRVWDELSARGLRFHASDAGVQELGHIVEQNLLLELLWKALPPELIATHSTVQSVEFREDGAHLSLSDGAEWSAALVVSAEGAESVLRERAGIETVGWSYAQRAIVCHVTTEKPHRREALQRFLPSGPLAFLPLADGRSSIVWSAGESEVEELMSLAPNEFNARLATAIQFELGAVLDSTPRLGFPLRLLHAQNYVRPAFALVGDSAHVIHPLAGQGVNLGLADAQQLVSTLIDARQGGRDWSSLRVLKRYERARLAANLEMMAVTDGLHRAFRLDLPFWSGFLSHGMQAVNRLTPIKDQLLRRALAS